MPGKRQQGRIEAVSRPSNYESVPETHHEYLRTNFSAPVTKKPDKVDRTFINSSKFPHQRDDNRIWIQISINGSKVRALCDTGATSSFISRHLALSIERPGSQINRSRSSSINLADGRIINSLGTISTLVSVQNRTIPITFIVMPRTNYELILGIDALTTLKAVVDIRSKQVTFEGDRYRDNLSNF